MATSAVTPDTWAGFLDDASPVVADRPAPVSAYVGARSVVDAELPLLRGHHGPVVVRLSGGTGQIAGPAALAERLGLHLATLEVTLRDPDDPAGNARRVVAAVGAARAEGALGEATRVRVRVTGDPSYSWLAAADEVAAAELDLTLSLDGAGVEGWVDAALDRELAFSLTDGDVGAAVAALRTTARLWGDPDDLIAARRWCRSWATADVEGATAHLRDRR